MAKTSKKKNTTPVTNNTAKASAVKGRKDLSNVNPELTDAFIKEVSDEVKNDNMKVFWNRYGLLIIAFVVIAVSAAVSFDRIKAWKTAQNQQNTEEYMAAAQIQPDAPDKTIAALQQISQENRGIFSDFARLQIANVLLSQNKIEEAEAALENVANDKQVNSEVRHIALIKLATYKLDTMDRESFEKLLQPVLAEDSSWAPVAKDLLAMSYIKNGDMATARTIYENILKIKDLPESFKVKVQDMLSSLGDL